MSPSSKIWLGKTGAYTEYKTKGGSKVEFYSYQYLKSCRTAAKKVVKQAAAMVHAEAKVLAPKGTRPRRKGGQRGGRPANPDLWKGGHRVIRGYPRETIRREEPKRLKTALYHKAREKSPGRIYAWVSAQYGYINFVIAHYRERRGMRSFLLRARDKIAPLLIPMFQQRWPK